MVKNWKEVMRKAGVMISLKCLSLMVRLNWQVW